MERNEKAFRMAKEINELLQQCLGIVGGTERQAGVQQGKALSPIDFCAIGDFGACNRFKNPRLSGIDIPVYNAVFDSPGESLVQEIAGKNLYESGGYIANKASAITMAKVLPESINEITIGELISNSAVPVTFDIAPLEIRPGDYEISREAFRKGSGRNWIFRIVNPEARYFLPATGGYAQLEQDKVRKYLKAWIPGANGTDWTVDFGALARVPHPTDSGLEAIGAWGCHRWGTFAVNAAIMLAHEMPGTPGIQIRGIDDVMAFLYDTVKGENLKHYELICCVLNRQVVSEKFNREITIAPVGLFEVLQ